MKIALMILIVFGLIGMLLISTAVHEYSHYRDYKDIATIEGVCLMNMPLNLTWNSALGYIDITYTYSEEYNKIDKYTEYKAYGLSFILIAIAVWSMFEVSYGTK